MLLSFASQLTARRRTIRIRWRRLLAKSWVLSRYHYRWHGQVLGGRPSDLVWYLAYGSNMHHSAFRERRGMRPIEWRVAQRRGLSAALQSGRPAQRQSSAGEYFPDPDGEMWGVLYRITRRELLRLDSTEGVPGRHYRHVLVSAEDTDGNIVTAVTYMAPGLDIDRAPSFRYISLLREGARVHGLPDAWVQYLDSVEHHAE